MATSVTLDLTYRPIKIAQLVDLNDKDFLLKAIHANTLLWGGTYNPIIPGIKRSGHLWKLTATQPPSRQLIIDNYCRNFDPDFIVAKDAESTKLYDENVVRPWLNFDEFAENKKGQLQPTMGVSRNKISIE